MWDHIDVVARSPREDRANGRRGIAELVLLVVAAAIAVLLPLLG